jgi:hypothetical protein
VHERQLLFGQDGGEADAMAEDRDRGERGVPGLLDPEQHPAHGVADADGHQIR